MCIDFDAQQLGVLRHRTQECTSGASCPRTQLYDNIGGSDSGGLHNAPLQETRTWNSPPNLKRVSQELLNKNQPVIHLGANWFPVLHPPVSGKLIA
jgi:hypothetical protein